MRSVCVVVVLQTLHLISFSAGQSQKEDGVIDREKFDGRMLRVHNFFRQNVTKGGIKPCAEPMPDLTWDPELASASRKWAERCVMKHDENKGEVGENLAASTTKSTKMIRSWYKEHVNYSFTPIVRRPKKVYGHYTQVRTTFAWEKLQLSLQVLVNSSVDSVHFIHSSLVSKCSDHKKH
ncbi:hypothetical protein P879_04966 [Paragonimus westermani]|uniref:SCP domain-containing protein n=1 Tax=Paragonimus westermani TaxID=34504 RepID=A0A8T0DM37_9TREM|nr:hypothetical protein P879_04966 [Paragonimus westermani]